MKELMTKEDYHKLFELISNEALMGFIAFNEKTNSCVYMNKLARELLGFMPSSDTTDLNLENLFPHVDPARLAATDFKPLSKDTIQHEGLYQGILIKKSMGPTFIATLGVKHVELNGEKNLLLMLQDTTLQSKLQREITAKQNEIKVAYEELLEQNEQLKALDLAKNRFMSLTTHELRTPVSAMVASAEILKMGLYDNEEQLKEFIAMIYDQGTHLLNLVNDILDFSKIQAGRMDYFVEQKNLSELVNLLIETNKSFGEADNIQLHFDNEPEDPVMCYYDDLRLKQVITNLISNAIKYNKPDGHVNIWLEETENIITCFVKDTGKGIPEDQISKVFDEFETLGKVALHHEGTGLGMPISKQLMEAMGGSIGLESEVGVGTTFWIQVPKNKILDEQHYGTREDNYDLAA